MGLFAIGDLHLSFGSDKPMEVFGDDWAGHIDRLVQGFSAVSEKDTVVLCGDLSWALTLEGSKQDFKFIDELPGRKILLKGNHDYFWSTANKMRTFFNENQWNFEILHNNCVLYDDVALCGTRGWSFEDENSNAADLKVYNREIIRLEASLKAGKSSGAAKIYAFLHYPPLMYDGARSDQLVELLQDYGVEKCFYGHLHGSVRRRAFNGECGGVTYKLVSADELSFKPLKII